MRSLLPIAATLCAAALTAQSPFQTHFIANSGQAGNMFDLQATNPAGITVRYVDANLDPGSWNVEIWKHTAAGPYIADVNNQAAWTLVGTALGVNGNGINVPTTIPIQICEYIAPNTVQAFYVTCTNGTGINYLVGTAGTTGTVYSSNADLNFYAGSGVAYPFLGNFNPRIWSGNIYYEVGQNPGCTVSFAEKTKFGSGSYNDPRSVHEYWASNVLPDLAGTSWTISYVPDSLGGHYNITAGGIPYDNVTPPLIGTDITTGAFDASSSGTWDDASKNFTLNPGQFPGGFPYPNGSGATATEVSVNSNGRIALGSHTDGSFGANGANSLYVQGILQGTLGTGLPMLMAYCCDMDPTDVTTPGQVWVDTGPAGGFRVTWITMNWQDTTFTGQASVLNEVQMELTASGTIFLSFGGSIGNGGSADNEAITGVSPGGQEPLAPAIDWSAITSTDGGSAPAMDLDADARPILGTTPQFTLSRVPAGSIVGGVVFGTQVFNPGIPLVFSTGIQGELYTSLDTFATVVLPSGSLTVGLPIPNNTALSGAVLGAQGFVALNAAFANSLNASVSNGVELKLGTD